MSKTMFFSDAFLTSIFIDFWLHFASQVELIFNGRIEGFSKLASRGAQERPKSDFRVDLRASRLDFEASWPLIWTLQALFSRLPGLILVALGLILQLP